MSERPQEAHIRAVKAMLAHKATHSRVWVIPCQTCDELRAIEDRAREACMSPTSPQPRR